MLIPPAVGLIIALATRGQVPTEMPKAWTQKYEAAAKAEEAGDHTGAEALLTQVVAEAEKLGGSDVRLAAPLEFLAGYYMDFSRKRYAEAEPLLRRALVIREKAQGQNHLDVAETLVSLAQCRLAAEGKGDDTAGTMLRRAMTILEQSERKNDPGYADALLTLSASQMVRGEFAEAEAGLVKALAIREKQVPRASSKVASLLDDLGDLHAVQASMTDLEAIQAEVAGKPKQETEVQRHGRQAESFYSRALEIREKVLKADHRDIIGTLYNLGQLAMIRGRPAEGERYLERWLKAQEKLKLPASETQAKVRVMLAGASAQRGDFAEAGSRLAKAQAVIEEVFGSKSGELTMVLSSRAEVALQALRFDEAETYLKRALEVESALIDPADADLASARELMAGRYQDHAADPKGPVYWHRLRSLGKCADQKRGNKRLGDVVKDYADLLERTNRVISRPTNEDLEYLKKVGAVWHSEDLNGLTTRDSLSWEIPDDEGLSHVGRLYGLERLRFANQLSIRPGMISDAGLAHIEQLVNLRRLDMMGSAVSDGALVHIAGLEHLEDLNLSFTRLGDAALVHLRKLKNLRELDLAYTNVTDLGLAHLKGLENLRTLDLKSTRVTEAGVDGLRKLRPGLLVEHSKGEGLPSPFLPSEP